MAKVTYIAPAGDEKVVTYMGVDFYHQQPKDIDDAALIAKATGNPHFEVSGAKPKAKADKPEKAEIGAPEDKAFNGGAKAKADGKERNVPPAYRGKPEEARWLAGYDGPSEGGESED